MVINSNTDVASNANTHSRHKASSASIPADKALSSTDGSNVKHNSDVNVKEVQLSQEAQVIERLETKIHHSEGTDTAKIDRIKQEIADGSYTVNSANIADQLMKQDELIA
ncbi:MAG: negative regulator of flagellin synthesis FlgM [Candidatus Endobugula sp.]|jgi:negative regulator of flagellin synthesis FlgM